MRLVLILMTAVMLAGCDLNILNEESGVGDGNIIADNSSDNLSIDNASQEINGDSNLDTEDEDTVVYVTNVTGVVTKYLLVDNMFVEDKGN